MAAIGVPVSGKISAAERAEPGRALARLSDIGWGQRLRPLLHESAADEVAPAAVLTAVVEVLKTWGWSQRPAAVAYVDSRRRPKLIRSVAEHIAEVGRLQLLGAVAARHAGRRGRRTAPTALSGCAALWDDFLVPTEMAQSIEQLHGAPVLLVDDLVDSGWTMTVVARELRKAGAVSVLPFALAVAG